MAKTAEPAEGRSEYFRDYYESNRDDINRKRKRRYHTDPEYKKSVLMASQNYRDKHRSPPKIKLPRYSAPTVEETGDGGEVMLFSVGAFARFLTRSVQAITHWEKGGVLPPTPYRDDRGHRFYTRPMMDTVKTIVGDRRRLYPVAGIYDEISRGWVAAGVPMSAKTLKEALSKTKTKPKPG